LIKWNFSKAFEVQASIAGRAKKGKQNTTRKPESQQEIKHAEILNVPNANANA